MGDLALIVIPIAAIAPLVLLRHWRLVVLYIPLLTVFEGALRKWVLPSMQTQIYFLKDALLVLALAGFIIYVRQAAIHERLLSGMKLLLLASLIYFAVQIANPNSPSPLVGVLGLKNYMLYVCLLFMVPYLFRSSSEFDMYMKYFMFLMIPVALLGLVQFTLPPTHWLNSYVANDAEVEQFISQFGDEGGHVRAAGTFSYIGGFSTFVVTVFNLSLAFCIAAGRRVRDNLIPYALLGASTIAIFTTGSRWVLGGTLGTLPVILILVMIAGLISLATFLRLAAMSIAVSGLAVYFAGDAISAMTYRANNSDSSLDRMLSPVYDMIQAFNVSPVFGTGIGTTSNGSWVLMGVRSAFEAWWLQGNFFEVETARVMQETGAIGFLLVYLVRIVLVAWAVWMAMRLRTPLYSALSASIAAYFIMHLGLFVINNPTAGIFYWYSAGLLFAMYRLDCKRVRVPTHPIVAPTRHPLGWAMSTARRHD